jgi:hypothetical protein
MAEKYIKIIIKKINDFLGSLIGILTILNWGSNPELQCDENSIKYSYAHSLSEERLEKIYFDLKKYVDKGINARRISQHPDKNPVEFSDLKYTKIMLHKNSDYANIRLGYCTDRSIDIEIIGLIKNKPIIKLAWGEVTRTEELLWSYKN